MKANPPVTASKEPPSENQILFQIAKQLRLKKRFSQNFLVNATVLNQISDLLNIQATDTVLEIGPGAGFLTEKLLARKPHQLYAVELDRRMCQYLSKRFPSGAGFELIEQDILSFDLLSLNVKKLKVVGNLPYNITSKIVFKLLGELYEIQYPARVLIEQLTIMVQKEVAERLVAKPGEKAYNALSIAAQMWFDPRMAFVIPASSFYPQPKVQSAVVTFTPRALPRVPVEQMANLSKLIRAAFSQKRKTLRNALLGSGIASQEKIDWALQAANITPSLRAEALSIEQFGDLASAFSQNPS